MEADTIVLIVTIVGSVLGSTLTTISLLLGQVNRQVNRLDGRLDAMGRDVADMGGRLARIEGCLMAPEGFKGRDLLPPAPDEASSEDPVS